VFDFGVKFCLFQGGESIEMSGTAYNYRCEGPSHGCDLQRCDPDGCVSGPGGCGTPPAIHFRKLATRRWLPLALARGLTNVGIGSFAYIVRHTHPSRPFIDHVA
jgi:hypothetical protein